MLRCTLISLLLILALGRGAFGQDRIAIIGPDEVTIASAGSVISLPIVITNDGDGAVPVELAVELPEGWQLLSSPPVAEVAAAQRVMRLVNVRIPSDVAAARYVIRLTSGCEGGIPSTEVEVEVPATNRFSATVLEAPRYAEAGHSIDLSFVIQNDGNVPGEIDLDLRAPLDLWISPVEEDLHRRLAPGEMTTLSVRVRVAPQAVGSRTVRLRVLRDSLIEAESNARFEVIPGLPESAGNHFPLSLTARAIGDGGGVGHQVELSSQADPETSPFPFQFFLRTPSTGPSTSMSYHDEYWIRYVGDNVSARLGDGLYALSPLTEVGYHGVGGYIEVRKGRFDAVGLVAENRWSSFAGGIRGGAFGYRAFESGRVSIAAIEHSGHASGRAVTARLEQELADGISIESEAGIGGDRTGSSVAHSLQLSLRRPGVNASAQWQESGAHFPGSRRETSILRAGVSARVSDGILLRASWNDRTRSFQSAAQASHNTVRTGTVGTQMNAHIFGAPIRAHLNFRHLRHERSGSAATGRDNLELHLGTAARWWSTQLVGSIGRVRQLDGGTSMFWNVGAEAHADIARHRLSGGLTYGDDPSPFSLQTRRGWRFQAGAELQLFEELRLAAFVDAHVVPGDERRSYTGSRIQLSHDRPSGHRISISGGHSAWGLVASPAAHVHGTYTVPLKIPLPGQGATTVQGRLFSMETGEGISGVPIRLAGRLTLTDRDGRYRLPVPSEGVHRVLVDPVALGMDYVLSSPGDLQISAEEIPEELNLRVVEASRIAGRTVRMLGDSTMVPVMAILEITDGDYRERTRTDGEGRFVFDRLPPAEWRVRVFSASLPERHRFETPEVLVVLTPGMDATIALAARPEEVRYRVMRRETLADGVNRGPNKQETPDD